MDNPVSFGCGVNSVAMVILLANEGWRGPILFADTGTEWPETYDYLHYFEDKWLNQRGLAVTVIGPEYRKNEMKLSLIEYCEHKRIVPLAAFRWCTERWKITPMKRWCKENGLALKDMFLGIASEEAQRSPESERPLVDRGIDRNGCARIIDGEGLKLPRKSGCYICPFQRKGAWQELLEHHPDLYERAAKLEESSTERRSSDRGGIATLSPSGNWTLRQFAEQVEAQPSMLNMAEYYQPCMCRL